MPDPSAPPPPAGSGRGAALLRYAAFIALTDYGAAILGALVFAALYGPVGAGDPFLAISFIPVVYAVLLASLFLPLFFAACAPAWIAARRILRARGVPNRRGALIAAVPASMTGVIALHFLQHGGLAGFGESAEDALSRLGVSLVLSLVCALLAAAAVYRDV